LAVVKELMGHRSISMTLRYTQLYEATKRRQYDQAMVHSEQRSALIERWATLPIPEAVQHFRAYLQRRHDATHTLDSYTLDLQLFFTRIDKPLHGRSFREIDQFIDQQHQQGLTSTTLSRRLYALKHVFDFLIEHRILDVNPVKPSHILRRGRTLPKALSQEHIEQWFAHIHVAMDRPLFLLLLRCGLRVSEVVQLKVSDIDWTQQALRIEQGKGRQDRRVYRSADAAASVRECVQRCPSGGPGDAVFWNQKRPSRPLSAKAIQKKMARYANAAGIAASCHSLRHTFASNLLEQGAETVSIRELLGHASIASSARYAKLSNQQVKQAYLRTMKRGLQCSKVWAGSFRRTRQ
jgi:integrase/recombinase XerC